MIKFDGIIPNIDNRRELVKKDTRTASPFKKAVYDTFEKSGSAVESAAKNVSKNTNGVKLSISGAGIAAAGLLAAFRNPAKAASNVDLLTTDLHAAMHASSGVKEGLKSTLGASNVKKEFITPALESLYKHSLEMLGGISERAGKIIDDLNLSKVDDEYVTKLFSSIENGGTVEDVLGHRMTLLTYISNRSDEVLPEISDLTKEINQVKEKYGVEINRRFSELLIDDINKDLPKIDDLILQLAKKTGMSEKECAEAVEKMTRFSSFEDFRALSSQIGDSTLLITDDVGFDQAAGYLMKDKLKCVQRAEKIKDYTELANLNPDKKYVMLLDDMKLKEGALDKVKIPSNVRGIYVGDIANNSNIFTISNDSFIMNHFLKGLRGQKTQPVLPDGVKPFNPMDGVDDAMEVLRKRFQTKVKPEGYVYSKPPYHRNRLTLDETRQLAQHRYDMLNVLNDNDITYGLKNVKGKVNLKAQSLGIKPDEVQYAIQAPSMGFDTKSQHLLAYKLKCQNPDINFAYMRRTPEGLVLDAKDSTKLVAYIDDYSGSGESLEKVANAISADDKRQCVVAPLVCAPQTSRKLSNEFAGTNVEVLKPVYSVKNFGITDAPSASTAEDMIAKLQDEQNRYVNIDDAIESIKEYVKVNGTLPEDIHTYEIHNGRLSELYASKVPPVIALDSVTGYRGSATGVLLPYMSPNTNSRNMNFIFKDTLKRTNRNILKTAENYKIRLLDISEAGK